MDPVRAEALRLAVQIAIPGNYENVSRRAAAAVAIAHDFAAFLSGPDRPPPDSEPQSSALAVPNEEAA